MNPASLVLFIMLAADGNASQPLAAGKDEGNLLSITCSMLKTEFAVGEELSPPVVTLHNNTDRDINIIGPTITVIECTLVQPDKAKARLCLAMPTGLDPKKMPRRILGAGTNIEFAAKGIWCFRDKDGFVPYVFSQTGTYELSCQYEGLTSSITKLAVKEMISKPTDSSHGATLRPSLSP